MSEPRVVRVPGDKSISHRALLLALLAKGESRIRNLLPGEDVRSTAAVLRKLGGGIPAVPENGAEIRVIGVGPEGLREPEDPLDCGNSGTTARLLLGVLAGAGVRAVLTGDDSLRSRPMRRVTEPLRAAGAQFTELGAGDRLPVQVDGGVVWPIDYDSPVASAQVKSALLLAALCAGVPARVSEPRLSRDHTERMLAALGVPIRSSVREDGSVQIEMEPRGLSGQDLTVPGDFSSAAFFLALGLLGRRPVRVPDVGLNPTRTGLLPVLERMGGRVEVEAGGESGGEPVGTVTSYPSALRGTTVEAGELPALIDEVPVLAILASRAEGETRIEGAAELRVKESDRLAVLASNLAALGVEVEEWPDGLAVRGGQRPLEGHVRGHGDHRIVMAFGVLGAVSGGRIEVDSTTAASVSFPGFHQRLAEAVAEG